MGLCSSANNYTQNAMTNPNPPIPPLSKRHQPLFHSHQHRHQAARAFDSGATLYDQVRPSYPTEVVELLPNELTTVVDIGCGTGQLASLLAARGHELFLLDPSADMVRVAASKKLGPTWRATAEATALQDQSVDAACCGQSWHWCDSKTACQELDRIIRPGGSVLLAWNTLDVSIPWVHRLSRIMHAGDVLAEGFLPNIHKPWQISQSLRERWTTPITPEDIHLLTHTRSYWLRANQRSRERVTTNLNWYLYEHLGYAKGQVIDLPYRVDAFLLHR